MAYIELEVSDVQSSQAQGEAFALILKEKGGDRFVPVVIGISEARAVVFELNRIKPHRPGPHDLFAQLADYCRMFLHKIVIWKFEAGVYYAHIIMQNQEENSFEIDARTSDAVTLALKFSAPIFIEESIFDTVGLAPSASKNDLPSDNEENADEVEEYDKFIKQKLEEMTVPELEDLLTGAIESEDYELASKIHEELNRREHFSS